MRGSVIEVGRTLLFHPRAGGGGDVSASDAAVA